MRIATLPPEYNYRGWEVRADTVILQRRELLPKYLAGVRPRQRLLRRLARTAVRRRF
jgi:hypothetical protein